jgi:hypothetical protein
VVLPQLVSKLIHGSATTLLLKTSKGTYKLQVFEEYQTKNCSLTSLMLATESS